MPSNILNLPAYTMLGRSESEHDYPIRAETQSPVAKCEACKNSRILGYGRIEVLVHDLPNRYKKTVANYLAGLHGKEDVRYVAIDMWEPYKDAVHEVLQGPSWRRTSSMCSAWVTRPSMSSGGH